MDPFGTECLKQSEIDALVSTVIQEHPDEVSIVRDSHALSSERRYSMAALMFFLGQVAGRSPSEVTCTRMTLTLLTALDDEDYFC